jgi:hypothetical protein
MVMRTLPPDTRIVWGARVNESPEMESKAHVMVILTGVQSKFLNKGKRKFKLPSFRR